MQVRQDFHFGVIVLVALWFTASIVGVVFGPNPPWGVLLGLMVFAGLSLALAVYMLIHGVRQEFYFWLMVCAGFVFAGAVYSLGHHAVPPLW
jgi:hypothetical protein